MPFYDLLVEALDAATAGDDESWKRAKATLLALYQQMTRSPDLIPGQVEELFDGYKELALQKRRIAQQIRLLSAGRYDANARTGTLNDAARLLDAI